MNKNRKREILLYLVPPIITVAAVLVIYALKGLYPFGAGTIMDNDWGPAEYPALVRFWDIVHSGESAVFDWSTGLGLPKNALNAFFNPINYILLFFKRTSLYEAMNYYYVAHVAVLSVTSFAFFRNVFKKLPLYYTYLFSLLFTFCGFCLQYYSNISWMSAVAVFPLVALAAYKLLTGKNFVFYVLILSYSLIISTYFSFFMLEGIILVGTLYVFCFLDNQGRKSAAFRLGTGTACSLLISFWAVVAFAFSTLGSSRVKNDTQDGIIAKIIYILKTKNYIDSYKILMLLGMEICICALAFIIIKNRKEIKKALFFVFGFVLFALPIAFESIDLMLNGGSYNYYPMRNGFLIAFFLCITAAYYFTYHDNTDESEKNKVLAYLKPVICVLALYVTVPLYLVMTKTFTTSTALSNNGLMMSLSVANKILWAYTFVLISFVLIFLIKKKTIRTVFVCILLVFVISVNSYRLIGARETVDDKNKNTVSTTETYIKDCAMIEKDVEEPDTFKRLCNPSSSFFANYPILINRTSIADWSHIVSDDLRLGYGMVFTSLSDMGSTAFGNALLCVTDTLSTNPVNNELCTESKKLEKDFTYYKNNYVLPFGAMFDGSCFDIEFSGNFFEYQNDIYSLMSKDGGALFTKCEEISGKVEEYTDQVKTRYSDSFEIDVDKYRSTFTYHVGEKSVLYFCLDDGSDISVDDIVVNDCIIEVNGETLLIPIYGAYRISTSDNVLELGTFGNEDVTLELNSTHPEIDKPVVYAMSLEKLDSLCRNYKSCVSDYSVGKKSLEIKATGEDGKYLFVPVYNNGNWVCTVNGEQTEVRSVLGSFTAIELEDGENEITLKYVPKTLYLTIAFSVLSAVVFAFVMFILNKKKIKAPETLEKLFLWALSALFAGFVAFAYIAPLVAQVYYLFAGRGEG